MQGDEEPKAEDEGDHDHPRVGVDQLLDLWGEEADAGDQGGQAQLEGQEAIHLAEET